MPGPASWSPDGRILLIPWEGRFQRYYHIHCLSVWSRAEGYREAFCKNPHFDTIQWAPDGNAAILEGGRVVASDGRVVGAARRVDAPLGGWGISWISTTPTVGPGRR